MGPVKINEKEPPGARQIFWVHHQKDPFGHTNFYQMRFDPATSIILILFVPQNS